MKKKFLAITAIGIAAAISATIVIATSLWQEQPLVIQKDEKLGLYVMVPTETATLPDLKDVYAEAASSGIGRNNVYFFWTNLEPKQGEYNWKISDIIISLNKQNNLKVTLYFSIINSRILGPFPEWMGSPQIDKELQEKTTKILDDILTRYDIIDHVIISGEADAYFREHEDEISKYEEFFTSLSTALKEKHPSVKFGNSFSLQSVMIHNQESLLEKLNQGDFVAFTYSPVNSLYEIDQTPETATANLQKILNATGNKPVGLMEVSWSTAESIGGKQKDQIEFIKTLYDFYRKNKSQIEFLTWFRQYDRSVEICKKGLNANLGTVSFDNSIVLNNTATYLCGTGLFDEQKYPKPSWAEFKKQIQLLS